MFRFVCRCLVFSLSGGPAWAAEDVAAPLTSGWGPPALKLSRTLSPPSAGGSDKNRPMFLIADRMTGEGREEVNAVGAAELRQADLIVTAERLTYWPVEDEVEGEGSVRLDREKSSVAGPKMRMRLEDKTGFFDQPSFLVRQPPGALPAGIMGPQDEDDAGFAAPQTIDPSRLNSRAIGQTHSDIRGDAKRLDLEGENHYRLTDSRFTTCSPGNDDWYFETDELKLDFDKEAGKAKNAMLYFKGVPLMYTPTLPFALSNARKSGFLAPSVGAASNVGAVLRLPYYWNIAPNMDAILTPNVLLRRGVLLNSAARYINRGPGGIYQGSALLSFMPNDKLQNGENRYAASLMHNQHLGKGFYGSINYNKVSDSRFFTDMSSNISMTSQAQLLQQALLSYHGGTGWNATANFQSYQTLQIDPANPVVEQYQMLPQLTLNARKPDFYGTDSRFAGQYTVFSRQKQIINGVLIDPPVGSRLMLYPQITMPFVRPGGYLTPKVGLNIRRYSLSGGGAPNAIDVNLPVFSVDSGMTFERKSDWFGKRYTQTLEPRLYYLNIPYRDQSKIPVFDTGLSDFNFAQIFSENQFSSWDRISNANQLTAGLSSRLIDHRSGAEIMRLMLGQRFYFTQNRVALYSNPTQSDENRKWDRSDFLLSFSGQVYPRVYADVSAQYNMDDNQTKRHSMGLRYVPEPGKVINVSYRYNRDEAAPIDQVDFSTQWPVSRKLFAVGRFNYSFRDTGTAISTVQQSGRVVQAVAGLEYKGDCWVMRGVAQRLALTQDSVSTMFFVQLELNDFASIGSNPIQLLRRNIQGYSLINEPGVGGMPPDQF